MTKDVIAIANSGGGAILIGCLENGEPCGDLPANLLKSIDPAVFESKIFNYTAAHLNGISVSEHQKSGVPIILIRIPGAEFPMPFVKVGTYCVDGKSQKTAFSQGTLYFRHSAKSEPAHADDLRKFVERKIAEVKDFWISGLRQIVDAPTNSTFAIVPKAVRLSKSPDAAEIKATPEILNHLISAPSLDITHPYRQSDVAREFNARMNGRVRIQPHHIQYVRKAHRIEEQPKFFCKVNFMPPRYSEVFVEWLVEQATSDNLFFAKAKTAADKLKSTDRQVGVLQSANQESFTAVRRWEQT